MRWVNSSTKTAVLRSICADIGRDPDTIVHSIEAVMAIATG